MGDVKMNKLLIVLYLSLIVFVLLLSSCGGSPNVQLTETSIDTQSFEETIHINNCGGMADSQQTASRTFATNIEGGAEFKAGYQLIIEGGISAKYGQYQSISKSQQVIAPAGTNMEFILKWSEEVRAGNVIVNGSTGSYTVRIPIGVDQVRSQNLGCDPTQVQQPTQVSSDQTTAPGSQPTAISNDAVKYDGWVICWHGRDGYEYLIAYPESDVKQGVNLNYQLTNAQGRQLELANDSLKMCYADGEWYGYPDPSPWFPSVSYMKLQDREILVCSDSPSCQGSQYTMLPEKYFPWNAPELQAPTGTGVHVISYKASS
jgi:hypothetical protein